MKAQTGQARYQCVSLTVVATSCGADSQASGVEMFFENSCVWRAVLPLGFMIPASARPVNSGEFPCSFGRDPSNLLTLPAHHCHLTYMMAAATCLDWRGARERG
jgi:hypothetical protein